MPRSRQTAYEAITLSAFLMLLMELVALGTADQDIRNVLAEKDKRKLPYVFRPLDISTTHHQVPSAFRFGTLGHTNP